MMNMMKIMKMIITNRRDTEEVRVKKGVIVKDGQTKKDKYKIKNLADI